MRAVPGLTIGELRRESGLSHNTVAYHLNRMERSEILVSLRLSRRRVFFPRDGPHVNGDKVLVATLRHERSLAVTRAICQNPGRTHAELRAVLGWNQSTISWHLRRLLEIGLLRSGQQEGRIHYYPGLLAMRPSLSEFRLFAEPSSLEGLPGDCAHIGGTEPLAPSIV